MRATGRLSTLDELADVVIGERQGAPLRVSDVATVGIGGELRAGSATADGEEVVLGTALMLVGANSRTVAAAVDAKMAEIGASLPPDVRVRTVLNRTQLVDATIATVEKLAKALGYRMADLMPDAESGKAV